MTMPGRQFSTGKYRFGFQGQEKDDEISGQSGSHLNYKYRIHDARIGRFLSVDPLKKEYPWNSNYAFAENRVIDGIDLEGREWFPATMKWSIGNDKAYQNFQTSSGIGAGAGLIIFGIAVGGRQLIPYAATGVTWYANNPNAQLMTMEGFSFIAGMFVDSPDFNPTSGSDEMGKMVGGLFRKVGGSMGRRLDYMFKAVKSTNDTHVGTAFLNNGLLSFNLNSKQYKDMGVAGQIYDDAMKYFEGRFGGIYSDFMDDNLDEFIKAYKNSGGDEMKALEATASWKLASKRNFEVGEINIEWDDAMQNITDVSVTYNFKPKKD